MKFYTFLKQKQNEPFIPLSLPDNLMIFTKLPTKISIKTSLKTKLYNQIQQMMLGSSNVTSSYLLQEDPSQAQSNHPHPQYRINVIPIDQSIEIKNNESSIKTQIIKSSDKSKNLIMGHNEIPLVLVQGQEDMEGNHFVVKKMDINAWKIGKMIGGGGSGRVHKALNITNGILSAVKKICLCESDEQQCKSQIAILSTIHHENIIRYIEHYNLPQQTWIFMQYVPGTLKNFYKDFGPPPFQTFLHFAKQLVTALHYLHKHKIIHKDIKCANVMLSNKGVIKLTDFGCSKGFDKTASLVCYEIEGNKTQKGTIHWMAPETITQGFYSFKTDIWSLGCTLLQLATGITPWSETKFDPHRLMMHIGKNPVIPLIPEDLNDNIKILIKKCLIRDPIARISIEQLLQLFQE